MYFPCLFSKYVSIASLVVPAISETITLSSPNILFISEDFPAFGLPITATLIVSSSSISCDTSSNLSYTASKSSPIPSFFPADIGYGSPSPKL